MVREFSEEKRQEIFRLLDEIDMKDWKSFMEWCGSRKEEFGDWPDKLSVSAYTRYVDQYHEKVLEINEMTRQQVNTVFENVAEIDARYAARLREHREKVKEQIAIVKTMTEFMDSMANGNSNMALLSGGNVSGSNGSLAVKDKTMMGKMINIDCYEIKDVLSLDVCGLEDCMNSIEKLHDLGFVSESDYRSFCYWNDVINHVPSSEADKIRNMIQDHFDHVITTVYIYNCLQVLAQREITPVECRKVNGIFQHFGITDCNSIACLLSCASGESYGFTAILENYVEGRRYKFAERGAGYLQVTWKDNQLACLQYIYDMYGIEKEIETGKEGYAAELSEYPWEATAWYWAVYEMVSIGENERQPLNDYVMERLGDSGGRLTLGIVLTAECFVNGVNSKDNICGGRVMDSALHVIVRYDSLRMNDEENNGGWYIDGSGEACILHIPAEMLGIKDNEDGTPASNVSSDWNNTSEILEFQAPNNWATFENAYNDLKEEALIGFDLN